MKPQPWRNYQRLVCVGVPATEKIGNWDREKVHLKLRQLEVDLEVNPNDRALALARIHMFCLKLPFAQRRWAEMTEWVWDSESDWLKAELRKTRGAQSTLEQEEVQEVTLTTFQLIHPIWIIVDDVMFPTSHTVQLPGTNLQSSASSRMGVVWGPLKSIITLKRVALQNPSSYNPLDMTTLAVPYHT